MLYIFRQLLVLLFFSGLVTSPVNYQVVASFGGRFLGAGFNNDETILAVAASTGISFYDLTTNTDPLLLNTLNFINVRSAAFSEHWIAIVYETPHDEQIVSLIELTSRSIHTERFFTTHESIETLKFSPNESQLAILGTVQSSEQEIFLVVQAVNSSTQSIKAITTTKYRSWKLGWSADGRFAAVGTRGQDLVIDVETGTELNLDPSAYPASLTALLETLDNAPDDYRQPPTLIISPTARYRIEYQEHGTGTLSVIDTTQPDRVYQLKQQFFGNINGLSTNFEDRLSVNFTGDGLHCNFDVVLKYENQQLLVDEVVKNDCTHGYMVEFFTPFVAVKPSEEETGDLYALAIVQVNPDTGLLSEEPQDRLIIEGHTEEIVDQHWLDNTHLVTISRDQTARFWTISEANAVLELADIQVVELGIDPTSLILWLNNDRTIIKVQTNHLQVFDFESESTTFGQRLQTIEPIGGDYHWLEPAFDSDFYTLSEDNVIRLWADVEN